MLHSEVGDENLRENCDKKLKLTLLDCQIDCHAASGLILGVTDGFANVFATMFHQDVGNFQASADVSCARWQWTASSAPLNSGTNRAFVTALEDNFAT